jgi:hypothetical protein
MSNDREQSIQAHLDALADAGVVIQPQYVNVYNAAPEPEPEPQEPSVVLSEADLARFSDTLTAVGTALARPLITYTEALVAERDAERALMEAADEAREDLHAALSGLLAALDEAGWRPTWAHHTEALQAARQAVGAPVS